MFKYHGTLLGNTNLQDDFSENSYLLMPFLRPQKCPSHPQFTPPYDHNFNKASHVFYFFPFIATAHTPS